MTKKKIIMESALDLFSTQGFEHTSIQQITDRAGISKGAFYLTFKSKDELIISLIEQFMNSLLLDIEHTVNSEKDNKIEVYLQNQFITFEKNIFFAKLLFNEKTPTLHPEIIEKIHYYYSLITSGLIKIMKNQYPHLTDEMLIEHTFIIQSLTACYGKLFIHDNRPINKEYLVANVYEKIDILIRNANLHFIEPKDLLFDSMKSITTEYVLKEIELVVASIESEDLKDALSILKNILVKNDYPMIVIQALITLLKNNLETNWVASLIEQYVKGQK